MDPFLWGNITLLFLHQTIQFKWLFGVPRHKEKLILKPHHQKETPNAPFLYDAALCVPLLAYLPESI
jgi:hypothetical protein